MAETNGGGRLENVPGFDAVRARNRGLLPLTVASAPAPARDGFALQNIIGGVDDRVPVSDTTAPPWRAIALLSITYEDGNRATGTAWFCGERALGTAGHNIRHPESGRAVEIFVSPGFDGSSALLGTYRVEQTYCDPRWMAGNTDPSLDFGVLFLSDPTVGRRLGWFGVAAYGDRELDRLLLNVSGYPTDRASRTQYYTGGRLEDVEGAFLHYAFDTNTGMSGSPIFALFGEQRIVVGIHTSGTRRANRARRIDPGLHTLFSRFSTT